MSSAINMAEALAARDAGITSSVAHANDDAPGWSQRAYQAIASNHQLRYYPPFTMEEAR